MPHYEYTVNTDIKEHDDTVTLSLELTLTKEALADRDTARVIVGTQTGYLLNAYWDGYDPPKTKGVHTAVGGMDLDGILTWLDDLERNAAAWSSEVQKEREKRTEADL